MTEEESWLALNLFFGGLRKSHNGWGIIYNRGIHVAEALHDRFSAKLSTLSGSTKVRIAVVCCRFLSSNHPNLARSSRVGRSSLIALRAMRRSPLASAVCGIRLAAFCRSTISSRRWSARASSPAFSALTRVWGNWLSLCLCTAANDKPCRSDMFRNGLHHERESVR